MLNLTLSWDLFIVAFFAIAMSGVFIIGKHQSVKIIIACYIAIIATQGIVLVLARILGDPGPLLQSVGIPVDATMVSLAKIFIFAICVLVFVIRSGIDITYAKESGTILNIAMTALFGFATAGLVVSTVLTYLAGSGVLSNTILPNTPLAPFVGGSTLLDLLLLNREIWFSLPAFIIVATGFIGEE